MPAVPVAPPAPPRVWYQPDSDELGAPIAWLYVSKRLDFHWLPNEPFWWQPVLSLGSIANPVAFFRLSARVLIWLEWAGELLQQSYQTGQLARDQMTTYLEAMDTVLIFTKTSIASEAVEREHEQWRAGNCKEPLLAAYPVPVIVD